MPSPLIAQLTEALTDATCQHCGRHPFTATVSSHETSFWDDIPEDESAMWNAAVRREEIVAAAPRALGNQQLGELDQRVAETRERHDDARRRHAAHLTTRTPLFGQKREAHNKATRELERSERAAEGAYERACEARDEARREKQACDSYLTKNRGDIDNGDAARKELDKRIDEIIRAYLNSPAVAPPWIRTFGRPSSGNGAGWKRNARRVIAYRRRNRITDRNIVFPDAPNDRAAKDAAEWFDRQRVYEEPGPCLEC